MTDKPSFGRIYFPGNPWPNGHAVTEVKWTARVERSSGIWFDLHLETEDYDESGPPNQTDEEEDANAIGSDWESKTVWYNHGGCMISSSIHEACGFQIATNENRLSMQALSGRTFVVDSNPDPFAVPQPFGLSLTGHDWLGLNCIRFVRDVPADTWTIEWSGRIAITAYGDYECKYGFHTTLKSVPFGGITHFPQGCLQNEAWKMASSYLNNNSAWNIENIDGCFRMLPNYRNKRV